MVGMWLISMLHSKLYRSYRLKAVLCRTRVTCESARILLVSSLVQFHRQLRGLDLNVYGLNENEKGGRMKMRIEIINNTQRIKNR